MRYDGWKERKGSNLLEINRFEITVENPNILSKELQKTYQQEMPFTEASKHPGGFLNLIPSPPSQHMYAYL